MLVLKIIAFACIAILSIALLIIILIGILFVVSVLKSAKYDYIREQLPNGNWVVQPVFHPCGEVIDEDFIREWNKREKLYKEWCKNNK